MQRASTLLLSLAFFVPLAACGGDPVVEESSTGGNTETETEDATEDATEDDHAHDEVSLGTIELGEHVVELAQGHGVLVAGEESHLVVKLPYSDSGSTIVRAWIGTEDRTLSYVGKADYAADHDDYDVHATAPDPLPDDPRWWVEIEKPDGTKHVGSAQPIVE